VKALSGREFCKLLESHGWVLHRISGSHFIYKHSELQRVISVPVHSGRTLKQGLQRALLKAAMIDRDF
jgi:predicted RNA binding protein YcfA (HicA-like mRNA interferase family)